MTVDQVLWSGDKALDSVEEKRNPAAKKILNNLPSRVDAPEVTRFGFRRRWRFEQSHGENTTRITDVSRMGYLGWEIGVRENRNHRDPES